MITEIVTMYSRMNLEKLSEPVHLTLDDSIMPRAVMPSRVPISMKEEAGCEAK